MTRRLHTLVALVVGIALAQSATTGRAQQPGPDRDFVGNEMLVQFAPGATAGAKAAARARVRGQAIEVVASARDERGDLELLRIPPGLAVADAVRGIEGDAAVTFAEPNWIYTHGSTSNDPYYMNGSLWGMYGATTTPANQFGSGAGAAWANGQCRPEQRLRRHHRRRRHASQRLRRQRLGQSRRDSRQRRRRRRQRLCRRRARLGFRRQRQHDL